MAPFGITLAYSNAANGTVLDNIRKIAASGTKTVVIVIMDKPVILSEFIDSVAGVLGAFGPTDAALLDVVFGKAKPTGKLPFDLPSDMPSVMAPRACHMTAGPVAASPDQPHRMRVGAAASAAPASARLEETGRPARNRTRAAVTAWARPGRLMRMLE